MSARSVLRTAFTTRLYVTVLVAIVLGAVVGLLFPQVGEGFGPVGTGFISLIQMLIGPVIFCTIVTGIASAGELSGVGRVGVNALVYFEVVTTVDLIVGLIVMDVVQPGAGVHAKAVKLSGTAQQYVQTGESQH